MTVSGFPGLRVLGDLAVEGVVVTRGRERDLLALLASARGPVPAELVLEELWGGEVSRANLHVVVSRLRALLGSARAGWGIERSPLGYRLVLQEVDAWEFEDAAVRALEVAPAHERLVATTRAEELWSGAPYPGIDAPSVRAVASRLEDLHLAVQEARADALLALGHATAAVRVLAPLAPENPYREQLWAALAGALYACSRQADALGALATLRTRLSEDLGVDPSALVRSLEHRILVQDTGLVPARIALPHRGPARRVRTRHCRAASVTRGLRAAV